MSLVPPYAANERHYYVIKQLMFIQILSSLWLGAHIYEFVLCDNKHPQLKVILVFVRVRVCACASAMVYLLMYAYGGVCIFIFSV